MSSSTPRLSSQSGVSLVELLVVCVIIAIVAALAIMSRGSANEQFQRQNASRELKVAFERARFDSVKRRADGSSARPFAYVEVRSNGFTLRTFNEDVNANPVARDVATPFPTNVLLAHYSSGTIPMTITFNRRGETSGGVPQFYVCNVDCSSPTNSTADIVLLTPTGTVNLLPGGASLPSFTAPSVSNVSNTSGVNPVIRLP